ncbi:hypothetical protein ACJ73_04049 [Blastomyces percursus]|uniref:Uncharacterized protein n=1 Tax=Blastomyces percursus TaxID=1658174 RepID=A0A1J9Q800_9EURO|nr:hypothetical protein ACJ73_04049 [Blastomyces percursus]
MYVTTNPCKYIIADNIAQYENFLEKEMSSRSQSRKRRAGSPPSTGADTTIPNNWEEINETLARPRLSLSPSKFSLEHFRKFKRADTRASKEQPVTTSVIPIIESDVDDPKCAGEGYPLGNIAPLTDGTLAQAKPDHFYGALPEQLDRQIRNELCDYIIPSTQDDLPMVPSVFLEAKGPDGFLAVATRQACYDGALGARGMHALQSYQQDGSRSTYDNSAYTLTSTYHGGTLKLYTTHLTEPEDRGRLPEYIMTQLNAWGMNGNLETFRRGACAYQHAQGKEGRISPTVDDSDISTLSDEAEYSNAHWSFAATTEEGKEDILSRNSKRPRVSSIGQGDIARNTTRWN